MCCKIRQTALSFSAMEMFQDIIKTNSNIQEYILETIQLPTRKVTYNNNFIVSLFVIL